MTAPVVWSAETDEALAARRRLVAVDAIRAVLGPSPDNVDAVWDSWLFVRELGAMVEGSGLAAAVLSIEGGWTRPNAHNTANFPRLIVEIYADPSRGANREITRRDAESRARRAFVAFATELHWTDGHSEVWGTDPAASPPDAGLRVWGCQSLVVPDVFPVEEWEGAVRLRGEFGLNTG